ncbi:PspC domain-containing protein [Microbacterium sp. NEAU-LLB]|uniref:PspC domain-containing protein n=2 Tax=Microbacterium stercoris TaxID=2820289 RepID=A0A939QP95_9MICO|nr:PspC domain-containing protein [Microbacterium stercoris]
MAGMTSLPLAAPARARAAAATDTAPMRRPRDATVAGVAAGLAQHLGWRTDTTRTLFVLITPLFGAGALFYLWLWAFTPLTPGDERVTRRAPVAWISLMIGGLLTLVLLPPFLSRSLVGIDGEVLLAIAGTFTVAAALWSGILDRADPSRGENHDLALRIIATLVLVVHMIIGLEHAPYGVAGLLVSFASLLCILLVWSPALLARYRELQTARVRAIRDEHRAEMAAHLHDSVLQTLALIQNRAGASSEAGRLARAQERELRAWLYDGDTPADSDLATDLRDYGSALELDYEVVMTVVSAGTSTERASGEVAAAAREAMLNAARHAGGEVSVYIEGAPGSVDVYIRDRGPGFELSDVPSDRLGVRESIIGRLRRIGGSAAVAPGRNGGTEVHIRFPAGGARG